MKGPRSLRRGSLAPLGQFQLLDGTTNDLKQYRGEVLILNFWATWCAQCLSEMNSLKLLQNKLGDQGVRIVAISLDKNPEFVKKFAGAKNWNFTIGRDATGDLQDNFNVSGLPVSFVIDRRGRLVYLQDTETGLPLLRFNGARNWSDPRFVTQLSELASQS